MGETSEVLRNPPCFRQGLMWGIATGLLVGGHRFRTAKSVRSACDWAILAFGGVSASTWGVCRTAYNQRVQQTRQFMEVMNDPNRKAEAEQFLRSRVQAADKKPEGQQ